MKFYPAPLYTTRIRPSEIALLIRYLEEATRGEQSQYLSGFLDYVIQVVLWSSMDENMSSLRRDCVLEQAEAILAEIRQHGEPHFWNPPGIEES
jgi:hypothetical protein